MKRVAIVNRTNLKNFGSVLQCLALCEVVSDLGFQSELVWVKGNYSKNYDIRPKKIIKSAVKIILHPSLVKGTLSNIKGIREKRISEETIDLFDTFVSKNIRQKSYEYSELIKVANSDTYYKFICGSDQVWCSTTTYVDPIMYLRFAPKEKRIAYAPSLGRDYIPSYNRREMRKYISEIPYVSVREEEGKVLVEELIGKKIPVVLDPTLLVSTDYWMTLSSASNKEYKDYILTYFLDTPTSTTQNSINRIANSIGIKIVGLGCELNDISNVHYPHAGPGEFIELVSKARMVITDSYHGLLFSVLFERDFISVERCYQEFDQSSRQKTILGKLGLNGLYVGKDNDFSVQNIDYEHVRKNLVQLRQDSIDYLSGALNSR